MFIRSVARGFCRVATAALFAVLVASAAPAADDHLSCFKIKAPAAFDAATIDLAAALPAFDVTGCSVKSKAAMLCVPADKTVVSLENGTPVEMGDGDPAPYRLCYKLKCPSFEAASLQTTDQFGTVSVSALKPAMVCTPAVSGTAPCLDGDADTFGINCAAGGDCDDADASVHPGAIDSCNGIDDDCDGDIDDADPALGQACSTGLAGVCSAGTTTCAGTLTCTQTTSSSPETCNTLDDDCDGSSDESVSQSCYSGAAGTAGVGSCHAGTQFCSAGSFGSCAGEVTPVTESCNNTDDDCDGLTDDGLTRSCYTGPAGTAGVGICRAGAQTCSAGSWGSSCPGEVKPTAETCGDAFDNDCDGQTNEGCP
jgi:hypothetical protein